MADEADVAAEYSERMMQMSLLAQKHAAMKHGVARRQDGMCANDCGDEALPEGPYCSRGCAEDHEKRRRLGALNGRMAA